MPQKANEKYRKAAEEFARRVASALGDRVDSIILYGSVARGEARRDSDIDILVISPEPGGILSKVSEICEDFTIEHSYTFFLSTVEFSRDQLDWHARVRSPFIHNVFEEALVLYDNGTFSRVRDEAIAVGR